MNESNAKFYYDEVGPMAVLKITGAVRFNQCAVLEYFLKKTIAKTSAQSLLIDLSDTQMLDSTALGLLAQIALQFEKVKHKKPELFCLDNDLKKILLSMSLEQLFHFTSQSVASNGAELTTQSDNEKTQTERVLSAHETLMDLSDKNKKEFKSVVDMLQEALKDR